MHELHAFVNVFVEAILIDEVVQALSQLDAVEELYEVTGEFDIVTLVCASDIEELSDLLKNKIMKIKGVKSTITSLVLSPPIVPKCTKQLKLLFRTKKSAVTLSSQLFFFALRSIHATGAYAIASNAKINNN